MKHIGYVIKKLRMFHGDKQKDLAAFVGISPAFLSEIEADKKSPSVDLLDRIAGKYRMFGFSIIQIAMSIEDGMWLLITDPKANTVWQCMKETKPAKENQ